MPRILLPACLLSLALLGTFANSAHACSIPVFRYALERWQLGNYDVAIFHRGPLGKDQQALADKLAEAAMQVNVKLHVVDLDNKPSPRWQDHWDAHFADAELPRVVVQLPDMDAETPPLWSGDLSTVGLEGILQSPVRQQLVLRLASGDSGVFLLLRSGDASLDAAAKSLLEKELAELAKSIELPVPTSEGPQLKYDIPLKLRFSILEMSRDAAAEKTFLHMLMQSDPGLPEIKGPIVIPIFGRGRMLCCLYDNDLNTANLTRVAKFLCGPCSCQVKELNPGLDLLISANWVELLDRAHSIASIAPPQTPTKTVVIAAPSNGDTSPVSIEGGNSKKTGQTSATQTPSETAGFDEHSSKTRLPASTNTGSDDAHGHFEQSGHDATDPDSTGQEAEAEVMALRPLLWVGVALAIVLVVITGIWAFRPHADSPSGE